MVTQQERADDHSPLSRSRCLTYHTVSVEQYSLQSAAWEPRWNATKRRDKSGARFQVPTQQKRLTHRTHLDSLFSLFTLFILTTLKTPLTT